jgi:hypothetical protein
MSEQIYIGKLTKDMEKIGNEDNKDEFMKNFAAIRNSIEIVDKTLKKDKKDDKSIKNKNINELYKMLEDYNINENEDIDAQNLRKVKIILDVIEEKIQEHELEIQKVK